MNPPQVLVLLMYLAAMSVTLTSGTAPVIATTLEATIADKTGSAMIPKYTVTDVDVGDVLTYTVAPTADFDVDSDTGLVTTKNDLTVTAAAAAATTYELVVSDGTGTPPVPVTAIITYTVFADTAGPTITGTQVATVAEDASVGADVIASGDVAATIGATDTDAGDGFTYELSGTGATDFKMDLFTGATKTGKVLDFEKTPSYSLTLIVKDSKRTAVTGTVTITVTDVDEAPVCNPDTIAKNMADGAAIGTQVVTLSCNDPDAGATIAYAIGTGDPNSYFSVSVGVITVAKVLDRATFASYALAVTATSNSKSGTVTVTVTVVDDEAPVCSPSTITKNIADDAKVGTEVTTLSCTDPESQALTYTFLDGNKDDDFAIDSSTGKITVDKVLDKGRTSLYVVKATVADTMSLTATTTTTINVQTASGAINIANHMYIVAGLILLMKYHFE